MLYEVNVSARREINRNNHKNMSEMAEGSGFCYG